jgi:acetyl-CoA carboxylase biotin carboxyl carrier protein
MTKKAEPKGVQLVQELTDIMQDAGLVEIEYNTDEVSIRLSRAMAAPVAAAPIAPPATAPTQPLPSTETAPADEEITSNNPGAVSSPMVGTVYLAAEPGAPNFVSEGDKVKAGQTLVIVEAMKVMNPITAPKSGTVSRILVGNAQPVEYGEVLIVIE